MRRILKNTELIKNKRELKRLHLIVINYNNACTSNWAYATQSPHHSRPQLNSIRFVFN